MKLAYRVLAVAAVLSIGVSAMAQNLIDGPRPSGDTQNKVTRRIKIRHADPYLIFLMLSGNQSTSVPPETSTVINAGGGNGGFGGRGFGGGQQGGGRDLGNRGSGPSFGNDGPGNRTRNPGSGPGPRSGF